MSNEALEQLLDAVKDLLDTSTDREKAYLEGMKEAERIVRHSFGTVCVNLRERIDELEGRKEDSGE